MLKQPFFTSGPESRKASQRWLAAILVIGLLLRVGICFFTSLPHMHKDSFGFFDQADTLLGGGYTDYYPNGYPVIIALVKLLFPAHLESMLLWLQIGMAEVTIWFVYDIARRLSGRYAYALLAALILAVFPSQVNYVRWLTSEVPAAFFLVGAFFFYYRKQWVVSGLFFGTAIVIRSNIEPVFLLLFLVHLLHTKKFPWMLALGTALPLLLIGFYCQVKTGKFSTAGNGRINILFAISANGPDVDFTMGDKHPEVQTSGQALRLYMDHAKAEPLLFIRQRLANYWELWGFYASPANGTRGTASRLLLGAGNLFLLLFGVWGWWLQRKNYPVSILIIPFVVLTLLHVMLVAMPRYTYPVEPFLILLGTWALQSLFSRHVR